MQPALTEASTLSQFKKKKTQKKEQIKKLKKWVLWTWQRTLIPKMRRLVLKEMFLAMHCLLVLRIQANFSHLLPSPLSTTVKSVCCKNTWCWLAQRVRPSPPLPRSALCSRTEGLSESSHKTPFLATTLTGALTLLNVTGPNCHAHTGWKWLFAEGTWIVRSLLT